MSVPFPDNNGSRYDHASYEMILNGKKYVVKMVTYKGELDPTVIYGNSRKPGGRTKGQLKLDATVEMYREDFDVLCDDIKNSGGKLLTKSFGIVSNYSEDGVRVSTDTLIGCRFKAFDTTTQEGADATTVKLPISLMDLLINGVSLV